MNLFFRLACISFLCISKISLLAQKTRLDSLYEKIKIEKLDTIKLKNINLLAFELTKQGQLDTARYYCHLLFESATTVAKENPEKENPVNKLAIKCLGDSYNILARCYYFESKYDLAKENYETASAYYQQAGALRGIGICKQNIGSIYYFKGEYEKALKNYLEAAKIYETIKYTKGIADMHVNIGSNYRILNRIGIALENYLIALNKYKEINDLPGIAMSYMNIGVIHFDEKEYDKAVEAQLQSLKIKKEIGDKKGLAESYCNLASSYLNLHKDKEALENYFISLNYYEELKDKSGATYCLNYIGDAYSRMGDYTKSNAYVTKALSLAIEIGLKDMERESYLQLSKIHAAKNNFKLAYEYHLKFTTIKDTLYSQESDRKFAEMNASYENDKKEKEIKLIKTEQEKERAVSEEKNFVQKIIIWSVIIGLFLVGIFAVLLLRSLRHTKHQKDIIEAKQKEILDSIYYAKRIQRSLLPTEKYIEKSIRH